MRRSIAVAGIFLIVVGSIFFIFGIWYAWMYGIATNIRIWSLLFPGAGGDLLSFISLSSSVIVLGIIFILWAYKLPNQFRDPKKWGRLKGLALLVGFALLCSITGAEYVKKHKSKAKKLSSS